MILNSLSVSAALEVLTATFPTGPVTLGASGTLLLPVDRNVEQIMRQLIAAFDQPGSGPASGIPPLLAGSPLTATTQLAAVAADFPRCLANALPAARCEGALQSVVATSGGTPAAVLAQLLLGRLADVRGDSSAAITAYAAVVRGSCQPAFLCATALWYQGLVFEDVGRLAEAQANYQRLIALVQGTPGAANWPVAQLAATRAALLAGGGAAAPVAILPLLPALLPAPPIVVPPPPPPLVIANEAAAPPAAVGAMPGIPTIPESDSLWLVVVGLLGICGVAARRRR